MRTTHGYKIGRFSRLASPGELSSHVFPSYPSYPAHPAMTGRSIVRRGLGGDRGGELVMADESILIVGEHLVYGDFASDLVGEGWRLSQALELDQGLELLRARPYDLVVIDADSLTDPLSYAIQTVKAVDPDLTILLVAPPGAHLEGLENPLLRPAGLLVKPLEKETLMIALESALVHRNLLRENRSLKKQLGSAFSLGDWVGCTPESQEVRKAVATAALSTGPVLLLGEGGTGRRLAAELIHRHGRNPNSTFLPVEIPSLPRGELHRWLEEISDRAGNDDLGSRGPRRGARPGAIYFSEITGLAPLDQEALLHFLAGSVPFRVMGSADPSIHEAIRQGEFDRRLFYQLSAVQIPIPPLRARRGDIPALVGHFLKRCSDRFHLKPLGVPSNIIESYMAYDWPGNVAELSMVIERAVSIASAARFEGATLPEQFCSAPSFDFPDSAPPGGEVSLRDFMADIERRVIIQTLARVDGSQKKAAERLHLNPTTLHEKMKRHKILP